MRSHIVCLFLAMGFIAVAAPAFAQRTGAKPTFVRKLSRTIPVIRSDPQFVFGTKADLQAHLAADRALKPEARQALAQARKLTPTASPTSYPAGTMIEATDSDMPSATLTPANSVTPFAYLNFENPAKISVKDNEAKFVQEGDQSVGKLFKPTAYLHLIFDSKPKRYYYVAVTFEYKDAWNSVGASNTMVAFPPAFGLYLESGQHFSEGIYTPKTYEMEWLYDTNDNGIPGWSGFRIALTKPGIWYLKSATIKEIAKP